MTQKTGRISGAVLSCVCASIACATPAPEAPSVPQAPASAPSAASPAPSIAPPASADSPAAPVASATSAVPALPAAAESGPKKWTIRGAIKTTPAAAAKDAVVYLDNGPLDRTVDGKMRGARMALDPQVGVMTVGGKFTFVNGEPFPDNIFWTKPERWDSGMLPVGGSRTREMKTAGVYTVLCALHPNEVAWLIVSPSSYFARTEKTGDFSISDIPAGTYSVTAWAPRLKADQKQVTLDRDQELAFELHR
jgi:plastocyanin